MNAILLAVALAAVTDILAQGKLAADLGDHAAATRAFRVIADDASAPATLRLEARVRLGSVRRAAGDHEGALDAFQRAAKDPALDRDTKALLVQALGGALPASDRWEATWSRVSFVMDRSDPARPGLAIRWPDAPAPKRTLYQGEPITFEFKDGDLQDVFRLFGTIAKVGVMVDPAVQGRVTLKLTEVPWDQALDLICRTNGLTSRLEDGVLWISRTGGLAAAARYSGEPITLDFKNGDLLDVLRLIGMAGGLNVVTAPGTGGRVTMRVAQEPWDKVLAAVLKMYGLVARREGNVLWVSSGWMPPTRVYSGKAIDVTLNDRRPDEAMEEIARDAGVQVTIDPAVARHPAVTLWVKQVPWDQALDLVARLSHLEVAAEGDRVSVRPVLERRGGRGVGSFRVREVTVRGVVKQAAGYAAFLLGPDHKTYFPRVGQKLDDGTITAIDETGVTFEERLEGGGTRQVRKALEATAADERPASEIGAVPVSPGARLDALLEVAGLEGAGGERPTVRLRNVAYEPIVGVELVMCLPADSAPGARESRMKHAFVPPLAPGQVREVPLEARAVAVDLVQVQLRRSTHDITRRGCR